MLILIEPLNVFALPKSNNLSLRSRVVDLTVGSTLQVDGFGDPSLCPSLFPKQMRFATPTWCWSLSITYRSATVLLCHRPWRFSVVMSAPPSIRAVALERRKLWLVYVSALSKPRSFATILLVSATVFRPTFCLQHLPFRNEIRNLSIPTTLARSW